MFIIHSARGVRPNPGKSGVTMVRRSLSAAFHFIQPGQPSSSCRTSSGLPEPPLTTTSWSPPTL